MAPRTAKAKKATEVSEAPKKGRGKVKNVEEAEPEVEEQDINEKAAAPVTEKKKRGKKGAGDANGVEENGKIDEIAPPAKKGKKKNIEEPVPEDKDEEKSESNAESHNADLSGDDEAVIADDVTEANSETKEAQSAPSGRGRKKPAKKEPAAKAETKPSRGRKAKQETESEEAAEVEEKPKPAAKGRGRKAQPKVEQETEEDKDDEEAKAEPPPTKGRKKAQPKPVKEKTPESDEVEAEDVESLENEEEPLKKKDTKGRRNQVKKAPIKEDSEEREEEIEEAPAKKRKVTKKEEKGKGDSKDEEPIEEDAPEPKPKGRGRGKKVVETVAEADDDAQDAGEAVSKRRRKLADDKAPVDVKKKPLPKNKAVTNFETLDFSNVSKNTDGKDWNFKIASWNVDGIRAWMNKGGLDYLAYEKPDILCLQETKCAKDKLPEELANVAGYHAYWECSDKDGYAGVGIYTTQLAMNVKYGLQNEELDNEGRIITAEYEQFYLICMYVPNAGRKLVTLPKRLQWNEEFRKFVKELDKKKPVIICGDMNVSHNEIDLANPKTNRKNAGFTDEERAGMSELLGDGFVDTFRHLYPDKTGAYTFWTYMMNSRAKNVGWRLDYFIVSERLLPSLCDNVIRDQVYGSDHCPISLFLHLKGADKPKE